MSNINLIVALCKKTNGIGFQGLIPWFLKNDLKHFQKITSNKNIYNFVIMGRKTWESIPDNKKPLKDRINIVLSKSLSKEQIINNNPDYSNILVFNNYNSAIEYIQNIKTYTSFYNKSYEIPVIETKPINTGKHNIFIIGGETIYNLALQTQNVDNLYITEVYSNNKNGFECDTFFPKFDKNIFKLKDVSEFQLENDIYYRYKTYTNINKNPKSILWENKEELSYIEGLNTILHTGISCDDRTGTGTLSVFGMKWEYDLKDTFPILTTKRIFLRGVFEELAFYISGKTDNKILQEKNIHIWDGNTSREFLDKRNLSHYEEGDMGETYGFNFRHFGAEYKGCNHDYTNQGFDQIQNLLDLIKNDPNSRRMLITLWNPYTTHKAALPSCLFLYQFYVNQDDNTLNAQIYLRSSDYFLANNWNVCTGALLIHMICNLKDIHLKPGKLIVITGDTHIYKTHIDAVKENLLREPRPFPKLVLSEEKDNLTDYTYSDIRLIDYTPYKSIPAEMAV